MGQQNEPAAPLKVLEVRCDEVRLGGHSHYTTIFRTAAGIHHGDGWSLSLDRAGVMARKEGRTLLVPWTRVHTVEFEQPAGKERA